MLENNKNTPDLEVTENENFDITEAETTSKKIKFSFKSKNILKNQYLFKKGGFSIALTAIFIVCVIVFNVLFGALSERFNLEFDMTKDKVHTVDKKNVEFIKNVDDKVDITILSTRDNYASEMASYAYGTYNITDSAYFDYYNQTIKLVEKYNSYNKNISVSFVDTNSSEIVKIASNYSEYNLNYGSILVTCKHGDTERVKVLNFEDIYYLTPDEYSYQYLITGNNIETALASAISYVTSLDSKTVGFITGHSSSDQVTEYYREYLKSNNYDIVDIDSKILTSIPDGVDALVIAAPTIDFTTDELYVIEEFLNNGGKLSKGLIFFADVTAPYLNNLYDVLSQWGIQVDDGILFETNEEFYIGEDPTSIYTIPMEITDITENLPGFCVTGYNVPLTVGKPADSSITVTSIVETGKDVIAAPKGTESSWRDFKGYTKQVYSGLIASELKSYDNDAKKEVSSYVLAFSSFQYIYPHYAFMGQVANLPLSFYATEYAVNAEDTDIIFEPKVITTANSFLVNGAESKTVKVIFMWILPIFCIAVSVVIYIKRRNA